MISLLAHIVAKLLPGNWTVEENEHNPNNCSLVRDDGLILGTLMDWDKKGADHVYPRYPGMDATGNLSQRFNRVDVRDFGESSPSINVSYSKRPELIARDIENRLLPDANRIYAKILERAKGINERYNTRDEGFKALSNALHAPIQNNFIYLRKNGITTTINTDNGKDFRMDISGLSAEMVEKIAAIIMY